MKNHRFYEWHSQDLRLKEIKDDSSPTISAGIGMGGSNMTTPMLILESNVEDFGKNEKKKDGGKDLPEKFFPPKGQRTGMTTFALAGNIVGRRPENGGNGNGWHEEEMYTLDTQSGTFSVAMDFCSEKEKDMIGMEETKAYGIHESQISELRLYEGESPTLSTGGGKPGQGFSAVLQESQETGKGNFEQGIRMDMRNTENGEQKVFTLDADGSNSMKSQNPCSGIHEADVAKTLDTTVPTPVKGQGGQMIVEGFGKEGSSKENLKIRIPRMTVRRLMPVETDILMGFPPNHTIPCFRKEDITDELVDEFVEIFYNWDLMNRKSGNKKENPEEESQETEGLMEDIDGTAEKSKKDDSPLPRRRSRGTVRAWLERISDPKTCPDVSRYKADGNSFCVNVVRWIGLSIQAAEDRRNGQEAR